MPEVGHAPLPGAGLPNAPILFDGVHHGHALGEGMRQRLLAVNIFFRSRGLDRRDAVPVIRRRDAHGVDVLSSQQFSKVFVPLTVFVLVMIVDSIDGWVEMPLVYVGDSDDPTILLTQKSC